MTLIGAFKAYGTPFLIGDFVLSVQGQRAGVRKKVHRLGPNCGAAWTGHLIAALPVFRALHQRFDGQTPVSKLELQDVLASFKPTDFGSTELRIIGWVIDGDEYCFRWRSDWTDELIHAEPAYDGSGQAIIQKWGGDRPIFDAAQPELIDLNLAVDNVLAISTNLMSNEILYSKDVSDITFGHAYEILYFDNEKFKYLDNILYFAVTIEYDSLGKFKDLKMADRVYRYRILDADYSLTECYDNRTEETTINVITPAGIDDPNIALEKAAPLLVEYQLNLTADFYCAFLTLTTPSYVSPPFSLIQRSDCPAHMRFIEAEGKILEFKMSDNVAESWLETIRTRKAGA